MQYLRALPWEWRYTWSVSGPRLNGQPICRSAHRSTSEYQNSRPNLLTVLGGMMSYRQSVHWIKSLVVLAIGAFILCVTQKTGAGADTVRVAYSSPTATQGILWVADVGGL